MSELAVIPVPLPVNEQELAAKGVAFISSQFSLGVNSSSDLVTVSNSSAVNCMQRVIRVLLTQKGSVPSNVTYGTNLIGLAKHGYNPKTLNEDIVVLLLDAEDQCKKQDIVAGLPLASQLGSIDLIDLVLLDTSQLKLTIGVKTGTGVTGSFDVQV